MRANQAALSSRPFAAFLVCETLTIGDGTYREQVAEWLNPVRVVARPVAEGLFAGVLDISKIASFSDRLKFRSSVLFRVWTEGDYRDWQVIMSWTERFRPLLLLDVGGKIIDDANHANSQQKNT